MDEKNVIGEITYKQWWKLIEIVCDLHGWARRYCDGRMSHVTSTFNQHTRFLKEIGFPLREDLGTFWARDRMGRIYDGLSGEESKMGRDFDSEIPTTSEDELQYARDEVIQAVERFFGREMTVHHQAWSLCSCLDCGRLYDKFQRFKAMSERASE